MDTGNRHRHLVRTLTATIAIYLMAPLTIAVLHPGFLADLFIALVFALLGAGVGAGMIRAKSRRVRGYRVGRP